MKNYPKYWHIGKKNLELQKHFMFLSERETRSKCP